jgi:hypothetical protein
VRSNGLAIIGYTEDDEYGPSQRLMVAMQLIQEYLPMIRR